MNGERKACEYTALLDAFVDGELPEDQAARLREHLDSCPACRSYLDDILAIREAFPTVEDTQVPEGFADRVLDKLPARVTVLPTRRRMLRRAALPVAASLALILALRGVWLTGGMNAEDVMSRTLPTVEEAAEEAVEETETADGPAADEGPADSGATTSDTDAGTPEDAGSGDAEAGTEEVPASGTDSGMAETASSTTEAGEETGADSAAADGAAAETKADSSTGAGNRENNTRNAQSASNTNNNTNTTSRSGNTARNKDSAVNGKTGGGTAGGNTAAVSEQAAPAAAEQAAPGETEQTAPVEAEQAAPGETEQTAQTASTPAEAEQTPPPVPPAPAVEQLEDGQEGFVRREWESGSSSPVSGYENLDGAVSLLGIDDPADGEALDTPEEAEEDELAEEMNETARAGYFGEAADASLTLPSAAASCLGRYLPSERTVDGVWYQMAESDLRMLADQLDSAGFIDEAARAAELAESAGFGDTFLVFLEA